jgi:hypothetical protein
LLAAARTSKALAGAALSRPPSPPPPPTPLSMSVERLAVKLRAFRTSLTPDEAVVLDDWLTRAARPS